MFYCSEKTYINKCSTVVKNEHKQEVSTVAKTEHKQEVLL